MTAFQDEMWQPKDGDTVPSREGDWPLKAMNLRTRVLRGGGTSWQPDWVGKKLQLSIIIRCFMLSWVFPCGPAVSVSTLLPSGSPFWFPKYESETSTVNPSHVFSSQEFSPSVIIASLDAWSPTRLCSSFGQSLIFSTMRFPHLAQHLVHHKFSKNMCSAHDGLVEKAQLLVFYKSQVQILTNT